MNGKVVTKSIQHNKAREKPMYYNRFFAFQGN